MVCGAVLCENCQMVAGYAQPGPAASQPLSNPALRYSTIPAYHTVCSWECFDRWAWTFISRGHAPGMFGQHYILGGVRLHPGTAGRAVAMAEDHRRGQMLEQARHLIEAEDHEAAAGIYQKLGMWKEAGEARRHAKRTVVTQVQVDVNGLIDQVRRGGLTTTYACPACHSPIQISGNTDVRALTHCQYCGSVIQSTDLDDFLTRVVGYR